MKGSRFATLAGTLGVVVAAAGWSGLQPEDLAEGATPSFGSVTGVVKFQGTPPTMPPIDMSEEPACAEKYGSPPTERAVVVNGNGTLAGVFVYVKEGLPADADYPAATDTVWIDQNACRYEPNVVGARVRQTIAIRNDDPVMHNVNATAKRNRGFNISQPVEGMVSTRSFRRPEVMVELACDVHGWMRAYIGVMDHPFFATTGDDGSFTIPDLPAGTYTLEAWHAQYGTQTMEVTVGDGDAAAEFTFGG